MSGLLSTYITGVDLNQYFSDKVNAEAMANGAIYFYKDNDRTSFKTVYELVSNGAVPPNYSYEPLPNPILLSGNGTIVDSNNNQVALYYYPYDAQGNLELYYITAYDADNVLQFTREAWPWPNLPTPGGSASAAGITNQITNPQFATVLFVPPTLTIKFSGAGSQSIVIAPDWTLNFTSTGAGQLIVTQNPVTGASSYPNNPPFTLDITPDTNISVLNLTQQFLHNPDWASPVSNGNMGYLSGSFMLGNGTTASMEYTASNGNTTPQVIINTTTNNTGVSTQYSNTIQLIKGTSTDTGLNGYDTITINLSVSAMSRISNIQVAALTSNISNVQYEQTTTNRNTDHTFNYYNSLLQYKPIPSWLIGWDFPKNPAQMGSSVAAQAVGANKSYYAWDQTILFQSVDSGITVSRDSASGGLKTLMANVAGGKIALIQYLAQEEVREMLTSRKCVNISAKASADTVATVSLWYTKDVSLPDLTDGTNNSIVLTLDANGYPATQNGTWVKIPRSGLSNTTATTNATATNAAEFTIGTNATSEFNQYSFSGWDMDGDTDIAGATFFAIVVGTASLAQNAYVVWQSASCQDGDIATIPAPQAVSEVLRECQYFWQQSYEIGVAAGSFTFTGARYAKMNSIVSGPNTLWYPDYYDFILPQQMRTFPNVVFYSPNVATVDTVDIRLEKNASAVASDDISWSTNWAFVMIGPQGGTVSALTSTTSFLTVADNTLTISAALFYHYTADARLGIV